MIFVFGKSEWSSFHAALRDFVIEQLSKEKDFDLDARIEQIILENSDQGFTAEDAIEEIVAMSCEDLLGSSERLQEAMTEFYAKNKKAANSFTKYVREVLNRLKQFFEKIIGKKSIAKESQLMAKQSAEFIAELQKRYDAALLAVREGNAVQGAPKAEEKVKEQKRTKNIFGYEINNNATVNEDLLEELSIYDPTAEVNESGEITVYHRTSKDNAAAIRRTGIMKAKEDALFFSSKPEGYASDYGDTVITLKIPSTKLRINDIFDGEVHFDMPLKRIAGEWSANVSQWLVDDENVHFSIGVTQETINNYVDSAYENNNIKDYEKYSVPTQRLIYDVSGEINLNDYSHALRDNDIRHIRNSHGENTNEKYPVTKEDIKNIPWLVENYDKVFVVKRQDGRTGIIYVKKSQDGLVYYLEQVTSAYGNEKLLINKQMIKTGSDDVPDIKGLRDAILKKQSEAEFLNDLKKVPQVYVQNVYQLHSNMSIHQTEPNVNPSDEKIREQQRIETPEGEKVKEQARANTSNYLDYDKPITLKDIDILRSIGRKSINKFTSEDIKKAQKWAYKFYQELGTKSPFFRAWFGDWREYDDVSRVHTVTVPTIDISQAFLEPGDYKIEDAGWIVHAGKVLNDDTRHHSGGNRINVKSLNAIRDILQNAVLLDTIVSQQDTNKKSANTAFLHKLYTIITYDSKPYIAKITVEEYYNETIKDVSKRAYNLKAIKIEPTGGQLGNDSSSSVPDISSIKSISDLFALVKQYDKEFSPKTSNPLLLDENKQPKVVYHGTPNSTFTVFDYDKVGTVGGSEHGYGFYFADSEREAKLYTQGRGTVIPSYINLQNPIDAMKNDLSTNVKSIFDRLPGYAKTNLIEEYGDLLAAKKHLAKYDNGTMLSILGKQTEMHPEVFNKVLLNLGYDGVIYSEEGYDTEYVVFRPEQIKSATDNIGTFDSSDPDIRYQKRIETPGASEVLSDLFRDNPNLNGYAAQKQELKAYKELLRSIRVNEQRIAEIDAEIETLKSKRAQNLINTSQICFIN